MVVTLFVLIIGKMIILIKSVKNPRMARVKSMKKKNEKWVNYDKLQLKLK